MRLYSLAMLAYRGDEDVIGAWVAYEPSQAAARAYALKRIRRDYPEADGWGHEVEAMEISDSLIRLVAKASAEEKEAAR